MIAAYTSAITVTALTSTTAAGRAAGRRSERLEVARPVEPGDRSDTTQIRTGTEALTVADSRSLAVPRERVGDAGVLPPLHGRHPGPP
ncbi:hypothetical protein AB0C69_25170, partial [Actinomadura sp. NPDC048032]|uniref:hypothetical protein n=1 Tax=Actinomadura sp. NPDC048032 TaxID=3155747 RepID=UPI003407384F